MLRMTIMLFGLAVLGGCASLTEGECRAGDWRGIGFEDGVKGRGPERLAQHREACAGIGITPDQSAWLAGRQEGLRYYCQPQNAYRVGRDGDNLTSYCSAGELTRMRPAWEHGRMYHEITEDIEDLEGEEDRLLSDLADRDSDTDPDDLRDSIRSSLLWVRMEIQQLQLRRLRYDTWPR
ncbi:DUF2799 domain-containing protein [Halovulum sp. GXIMD14793]